MSNSNRSALRGGLGLLIISIFVALVATLVGCATLTPNTSALPKDATQEQRQVAAIADARLFLEKPATQQTVHDMLVVKGKSIMRKTADQEAAAEFMFRCSLASLAVSNMAEGGTISEDQLREVKGIFSKDIWDDDNAEIFLLTINTSWLYVYPQLEQVQDIELIRTYLNLISSAFAEITLYGDELRKQRTP